MKQVVLSFKINYNSTICVWKQINILEVERRINYN